MKAIALISGGIDSPVAVYLMMKQGVDVVALHLDTRPYSDETPFERTKQVIKILEKHFNKKIPLKIIPHAKNQKEIAANADKHLRCVLCRRIMYRIAEKLAEKEGADFIFTGEAIGQKASQTLENLYVIDKAISMPVLRPLIGFDKEDTIKIAKEIGTFDTTAIRGGCCSLVPDLPATRAVLERVEDEEKKINIEKIIKEI
ncbi:MAG: 7-cyano-7-deazaguanine synthase [Nanoarchaeota archaeon]|nr:7-cyano-7-deazaguanine synthase [Nanoarchaeota archaeon]MBU1135613.1 7-cyano-7-deazaguanine synthase [Nanoarchaeota archaeon]